MKAPNKSIPFLLFIIFFYNFANYYYKIINKNQETSARENSELKKKKSMIARIIK